MISPSVSYIFDSWLKNTMNWITYTTSAIDIPTVIICGGVFVISAAVVYLISAFGMRERTYEEAMEEQRRRNQEAVQHSKNDKGKKDKKFKKWGKRSKEKTDEERSQTCDGDNKVISDEMEVKGDSGSNSSSQNLDSKVPNKKKSRQRKTMMLGKDERAQQLSSSDETDEPPSVSSSPDIQSTAKEEAKPPLLDKSIRVKEDFKSQNVESQMEHQVEFQDKAEMTDLSKPIKKSPVKKKKNRNDHLDSGTELSESNETKILNTIKMTSLNDDELQRIIDVLSSRQKVHEKRKNEIHSLKKLIQEKEDALRAEQKSSHAASEKVNDLIQELSEAKAHATAIEKSLRTALNQEQQEIKGLHDMMQRKQKHYSDEIAALQSKMKKMKGIMKEEHALAIQRLQEENSQLQSLNRMESEKNQRSSMEISRLQHEIDQLRSSREKFESHQTAMQQSQEDLHHQIQQLEQIISSHQEEDYSYKQRINEMSNKIQQAENARSSLVQELQNAQSVCSSLEADNSSLRQRLEEAKHQLNSSEQSVLQLQSSLEESNRQQRDLANCLEEQLQIIASIKQENEVLASQVKQFNQRLVETSDQNNDTSEKVKTIDLQEHEAIFKKNESLVHQLMDELNQCNNERDNLLNEVTSEKKKIEELNEKNCDLNQALQVSQSKMQEVIKSAELKVQEAQMKVDNNSKEMQNLLNEQIKEVELALRESFSKELKNAHQETENVKKQADERVLKTESQANLRLEEFQESLYERLNLLNCEAESKVQEAVKEKEKMTTELEELKLSLKGFLQKIFPDLQFPDKIDNASFWKDCEKQVKLYIDELKVEKPHDYKDLENMVKQLEEKTAEKKNLETQITNYKSALHETENILKTLEDKVETEEKIWKSELQSKDDTLIKIESENKGLKLENENLRISLEQLQELRESLCEVEELRLKLHKEEEDKKILQEKIKMINTAAKSSSCPINENNILEFTESNILPNKSEKRKKPRKRGNSGKK